MKKLKIFGVSVICALLPLTVKAQVTLTNPLGTADVRVIIARVIQGALAVSGSIALLMIIYGGLLWLTSAGQPAQVDKGKKVLVWAILGIILIASAYTITQAVFQAVLTGGL